MRNITEESGNNESLAENIQKRLDELSKIVDSKEYENYNTSQLQEIRRKYKSILEDGIDILHGETIADIRTCIRNIDQRINSSLITFGTETSSGLQGLRVSIKPGVIKRLVNDLKNKFTKPPKN